METAIFASKHRLTQPRTARLWGRGVALACLLLAGRLQALGVGDITLHSALNQPLHAEIALQLAEQERLEDVTARLGDREAYRRAELVRPEFLSRLRFTAERNAAGQAVLRISSREVVREPVLELLLDVRWHDGRMLRQYALLFDLPGRFTAPTPPAASAAAPAAGAGPVKQAPSAAGRSEGYGPVKRGEILGEIARRLKPAGVSTEQMSVALYQANPQAFLEGNINRLRWGTTLFMPSDAQMHAMTRGEAGRFIHGQYEQWRSGGTRAAAAPAQEAVPTATAAEAPRESAAPASAGSAQLQILAPSPSPADAMVDELQARLVEVQRINQEVQAENLELRAKLAELEAQTRVLAERVLAVAPEAAAEVGLTPEPAAEPVAAPRGQELVGDVPPGLQLEGEQPAPRAWWRDPFWWLVGAALLVGLVFVVLGRFIWRRYHDVQYRGFEQALKDEEAAKERARLARRAQVKRRFG